MPRKSKSKCRPHKPTTWTEWYRRDPKAVEAFFDAILAKHYRDKGFSEAEVKELVADHWKDKDENSPSGGRK